MRIGLRSLRNVKEEVREAPSLFAILCVIKFVILRKSRCN